jgi:hypothetical protein
MERKKNCSIDTWLNVTGRSASFVVGVVVVSVSASFVDASLTGAGDGSLDRLPPFVLDAFVDFGDGKGSLSDEVS